MIGVGTTIFLVRPEVFPSGASYLLDTYSAAAAYSLRQLKTGVTNVVRVRRSSDSAESDFTADEITDGTLTTWTGANDGFVVTWYDQAGSNNATQTTATAQPKLVVSGVVNTKGGKPSALFNATGTADYMTAGATSELQSYPFAVFGVFYGDGVRQYSPTISQRLITGSLDGYSMFCDNNASAFHSVVDESATNIFNYLATTNHINNRLQTFNVTSGGNGTAYLDGTLQETINSMSAYGTAPNTPLNIGRQDLGSLYHNGGISELILFNTDESANRTAIESDINTHYSIY